MDGVREYRGGVLNFASGVGATTDGSSPSNFRWVAVNGISESSSFGRMSGRHAMPIWMKGRSWARNQAHPRYSRSGLGNLNRRSGVRKCTIHVLESQPSALLFLLTFARLA
jgi:hypothetical protein